jgi:hypothetical protein
MPGFGRLKHLANQESLYIDGQWGEQEEILMDDFSEETGEFEEVESAAAKEVRKVLVLFKSKV